MSVIERIETGELRANMFKILADGTNSINLDKELSELLALAKQGEKMRWLPVSEPPKKFGWYLGAVNPKNYKDLTQKQINEWRKQFGCTKVWYNPDSVGKWYEPSGTSISPECVGDRITHWTNLLEMPLPEPPKDGE